MAHFAGASTLNFGGATPTGNFVPTIYSKQVQLIFRRKSVVEMITNNDYLGEITDFGDTVQILKEPTITVSSYTRNATVAPQSLTDDEIVLVLDQANKFAFKIEDIETRISHINWEALATNRAAYQLKNHYDREVLAFMADPANILDANEMNDQDEANTLDWTTPDALLNGISSMSTRLSLQDVPEEDRFLVLPYEAMEVLARADSKLLNADTNGGAANLQTNPHFKGTLRGFQIYATNDAPTYTSTGTGGTNVGRYAVVAGHMSAVATANSILKTEKIRDQDTFADIVRGLHVYGRAVVRPESLAVAHAKFA